MPHISDVKQYSSFCGWLLQDSFSFFLSFFFFLNNSSYSSSCSSLYPPLGTYRYNSSPYALVTGKHHGDSHASLCQGRDKILVSWRQLWTKKPRQNYLAPEWWVPWALRGVFIFWLSVPPHFYRLGPSFSSWNDFLLPPLLMFCCEHAGLFLDQVNCQERIF